jgi:hypothetical protein
MEEGVEQKRGIAKKLDAIGWGAFFIWIGIVLLSDVHIGWALAGVGLITLGAQVARVAFGLRMEGFWVIVGSCFLFGGAWELVEAQIPLVPVLLIVGGMVVILASFWPKTWKRKHA